MYGIRPHMKPLPGEDEAMRMATLGPVPVTREFIEMVADICVMCMELRSECTCHARGED